MKIMKIYDDTLEYVTKDELKLLVSVLTYFMEESPNPDVEEYIRDFIIDHTSGE